MVKSQTWTQLGSMNRTSLTLWQGTLNGDNYARITLDSGQFFRMYLTDAQMRSIGQWIKETYGE